MRKIIILRGIPACGKSSYALNFIKENPTYVIVSRDGFRRMLIGDNYSQSIEKIVTNLQEHAIETILGTNKNIIIDNTHVKESYVSDICKLAERIGNIEVSEKIFDVPYLVCRERNNKRIGVAKVPEDVMASMWENFQKIPKTERTWKFHKVIKTFERDENLPEALLVDVDGTLSLNYTRSPFEWSRVLEDKVNIPVADIVRMYHKQGIKVIIFSGRDSDCKELTCQWLRDNSIPYDYIFMRANKDMRKDSIVKREIYENNIKGTFSVLFMLDDRDQVIREMRELGLTVLQVNYGNF